MASIDNHFTGLLIGHKKSQILLDFQGYHKFLKISGGSEPHLQNFFKLFQTRAYHAYQMFLI